MTLPKTTAPMPVALRIDHAGASVANLEASTRFYCEVLGFAVEEHFQIPSTPVRGAVLINAVGTRVELFCRPDSLALPSGHPIESTRQQGWFQLAFAVGDLATTYSQVLERGARSVKPPFRAPDGRAQVAFIADPDGHLIELIQRQ